MNGGYGPYYPNSNLFSPPPAPPTSTFPQPPNMQDAEKAFKLLSWFNSSGLTADELDALSNLKKSGKDINKLLGIKKDSVNNELESLRSDMKELKEIVNSLVSSFTEPKKDKE